MGPLSVFVLMFVVEVGIADKGEAVATEEITLHGPKDKHL